MNKFSSRFDQFLALEAGGDVSEFGVEVELLSDETEFRRYVGPPIGFISAFLTPQELEGLALFNADSATQLGVGVEVGPVRDGGMCYLCHLTTNYDTNDYGPLTKVAPGVYPPVFTDFSYDNLGVPVNSIARDLSMATGPDNGLGAQTAILNEAFPPEYTGNENGKFKVPSLRGVGKSAPYGHNGFFPTLTQVVNFYNDRAEFYTAMDVVEPGTGVAEVTDNVNEAELGNLGMDPAAIDAIVAFMKSLTDI